MTFNIERQKNAGLPRRSKSAFTSLKDGAAVPSVITDAAEQATARRIAFSGVSRRTADTARAATIASPAPTVADRARNSDPA